MRQCNPGLSKLISDTLKLPKATFLKDLTKLEVRPPPLPSPPLPFRRSDASMCFEGLAPVRGGPGFPEEVGGGQAEQQGAPRALC